MSKLKLNYKYTGIEDKQIMEYSNKVLENHNKMQEKQNDEKEFLGWLNLPTNYNKEEFEKIKKCSKRIRKNSDVFVVIGIGGSYLGARAVNAALNSTFFNMETNKDRKAPNILYVGNNLSPNYITDLIGLIEDKDISINVISKSGTTTEPAIAFRIFREWLENKYGLKKLEKEYM